MQKVDRELIKIKEVLTQEDFFRAIRAGNYETVSQLALQHGACTDTNGYTPLMHAITAKQERLLPLLVASSSGIATQDGEYAITIAAELEFLPGVLAILPYEHQYRNKNGDSALHILARKNITSIIPQCSQYLERVRDSLGRIPIDVAAEQDHVEFLKTAIESKLSLTPDDVLRAFCAARHAGKINAMNCLREYIFVEPVECLCYQCSNVLDFSSANSSRIGTPILSRYSSICRTPVSVISIRSQRTTSAEQKPSLRSPFLSPRHSAPKETISIGIQVSTSCDQCLDNARVYEEQIRDLNTTIAELTQKLKQASTSVNPTMPLNSSSIALIDCEKKPRTRMLVEAAPLSFSSLEKSERKQEHISVTTPTVRRMSEEDIPPILSYSSSHQDYDTQPLILQFHGFQDVTELASSQLSTMSKISQIHSTIMKDSQQIEDLGSIFDAPDMHNNMTDLMRAACSGNIGLMRKLVTTQSRQQTDSGHTALMFACRIGNYAAAKMLLQYEAGMQTKTGATALMEACTNGNRELAELLLIEEGTFRKDGWSALMSAARSGLSDIVRRLLPIEAGRSTVKGITALMKAVEYGHYSCVSILLPSEVYLKTKDGQMAIDIALKLNNVGLIGLIENYMKSNPPTTSPYKRVLDEINYQKLTNSEIELLMDIDKDIEIAGLDN